MAVPAADWIDQVWLALSQGDLAPLEAVLAPDARWRAVQDGPWNCQSRSQILEVMGRNQARGRLAGRIEERIEVGERVIVAFRPEDSSTGQWPLENGIRHMVLSTAGGLVTEMKGCATRREALAYAGAPEENGA